MKRWSVAIEVDVSFPATSRERAEERAEAIARAMGGRLMGRTPPGWPLRSAQVHGVLLNTEPGAVLEIVEVQL